MVEPLAVGVYAAELAASTPASTIAILGVGGHRSFGPAGRQNRRGGQDNRQRADTRHAGEIALKLGADEAVEPSGLADAIARATNGRGVDIAFECSGSDEAVRDCCEIARVLGKVMILGIPDGDTYPFAASPSRRKQLSAMFVRRSNLTTEKSIEWVAEGKVRR